MDNTRFDPMRFSPEDLPSLEQLMREQVYQNRVDVDAMNDYLRPDPSMSPYPAQGYYPAQQDPAFHPYPAYPSSVAPYGFGQGDPMPGNPYADRSFAPTYGQPEMPAYPQAPAYGQSAYGQQPQMQPAFGQPPFAQPAYNQPPFAQPNFGQPVYGQPAYEAPMRGYLPNEPEYRPQPMRPDPRFEQTPQQNGYADPYYMPQHTAMPQAAPQMPQAQPQYGVQQPQPAAPQQPTDSDHFDALPSLAQLHQALEDERRVPDLQHTDPAPQMPQAQHPVQPPVQPPVEQPHKQPQTPAHTVSQPAQRFVIEDLALEEDEEDHTKKKEQGERSQFSSLLRRFLPKNN